MKILVGIVTALQLVSMTLGDL